MDFISEIVPVRPLPGKKVPGALKFIRSINTDLIGIWPESAYRMKSYMLQFGRFFLYIANSPETVEHVFVKNNQNYNRKVRKALEPLLGDGLFISEGEVWQQRRDMEEPGFKPALLRKFATIMTDCALECRLRWEMHSIDKPILMLTEMASLTAEVLCRSLFGKHLGRHNAESIISGFSIYQALVRHIDRNGCRDDRRTERPWPWPNKSIWWWTISSPRR
ncbi:MAG: cytochrome P450 [Gammaproteobacteria bacterium]|nr:cytochrome P450 [Gammaproteobacteria bacterium]